jgi:hypothetical protein
MTAATHIHLVPSLLVLKFPDLQGQGAFGQLMVAVLVGALLLIALFGVARGASENPAAAPTTGSVGVLVILVLAVIALATVMTASGG